MLTSTPGTTPRAAPNNIPTIGVISNDGLATTELPPDERRARIARLVVVASFQMPRAVIERRDTGSEIGLVTHRVVVRVKDAVGAADSAAQGVTGKVEAATNRASPRNVIAIRPAP
jgi:hypothetical protein